MISMTTVTMVMFVYSSLSDYQLLDFLWGSDLYIYQLKGNENNFMSKHFHSMKTRTFTGKLWICMTNTKFAGGVFEDIVDQFSL